MANPEQVLELDVVTTKMDGDHFDRQLIEIKSGKCGFPDIFKVRGWMDYLHIPHGGFIQQKSNIDIPNHVDICNSLDIIFVVNPFDDATGKMNHKSLLSAFNITPTPHFEFAVEYLRFAYALEQRMNLRLNQLVKSATPITQIRALQQYWQTINGKSFFISTPIDRVLTIMQAFSSNRNITAHIESERLNETPVTDSLSSETYNSLFYDAKMKDDLYVSLHVEFLSRLAVLKCVVEDIISSDGLEGIKKYLHQLQIDGLPSNLFKGILSIRQHQYFYLYPYFWQIFYFLFGGFILQCRKDEEYQLLSELTGVPVAEIDNALSAFDILFPIDGSWLLYISNNNIRMLKLMSLPFAGIGVNFRRSVYTHSDDLDKLKDEVTGPYTFRDMMKWTSLAFQYLEDDKELIKK